MILNLILRPPLCSTSKSFMQISMIDWVLIRNDQVVTAAFVKLKKLCLALAFREEALVPTVVTCAARM